MRAYCELATNNERARRIEKKIKISTKQRKGSDVSVAPLPAAYFGESIFCLVKCENVSGRAVEMAKKLNTLEDLANLGESWVELSVNTGGGLASVENEYIRLLREAQRESRDSSVRQSRASSLKSSPKSPPNSPNLEPSTEDELKGVYINCWPNTKDDSNDWVWEWSSRPDQLPPKDWRFRHPVAARGPPSATSSIEVLDQPQQPVLAQSHFLSVRRSSLFSRGALAAVLVTNLLSLLLGAGIGVWLSKKGVLHPRIVIQ